MYKQKYINNLLIITKENEPTVQHVYALEPFPNKRTVDQSGMHYKKKNRKNVNRRSMGLKGNDEFP